MGCAARGADEGGGGAFEDVVVEEADGEFGAESGEFEEDLVEPEELEGGKGRGEWGLEWGVGEGFWCCVRGGIACLLTFRGSGEERIGGGMSRLWWP